MPGASAETRRVKNLNANWSPGTEASDDRFELQIITDDDQHHGLTANAASVNAIIALAQSDTVLAWDPTNRTLIVANIVGKMPWTENH